MNNKKQSSKKIKNELNKNIHNKDINNRKIPNQTIEIQINKQAKNTKENQEEKKDKKPKKKKRIFLKVFLAFLLIIVMAIGGFVAYSTYKNGWGVKGILQTALGQDKHTLENLDPFTVLILGVSKDIDSELTDTIMVASYNPKKQTASLLSIPRDTFTGKNKNKATASEKINALYQKSPDKTLSAVNEITGLNIEKYIVVENNALVQLVDAIGGVEFDVPIDMDYDDVTQDLYIHLSKGYQRLDGEQAEHLVRFRKNNNGTTYSSEYGDNDLGRMRTQREFLKAVAEQTMKLKNITKIGEFVDIFKQNVKTNITDWEEIKKYIPYAIEFDTSNLEAQALPGEPAMFNKLWFFVHDKAETAEIVEELFLNQDEEEQEELENEQENNSIKQEETQSVESKKESEKQEGEKQDQAETNKTESAKVEKKLVKIEVLNGTSNSKKLTEVTNTLKEKGYNVYTTGTTTATSKTTIMNRAQIDKEFLDELKSDLGAGIVSNSNSNKKSNCDITIIIGKDYN